MRAYSFVLWTIDFFVQYDSHHASGYNPDVWRYQSENHDNVCFRIWRFEGSVSYPKRN
jgi:hypothetical protein